MKEQYLLLKNKALEFFVCTELTSIFTLKVKRIDNDLHVA